MAGQAPTAGVRAEKALLVRQFGLWLHRNVGRFSPVSDLPRPAEPGEFIPADYFRRLNREELFADEAPLEVDLGAGDGTFLLQMAAHYPERRFLGVERLLGRVRKICRRAEREGLHNVRVLRLEAKYTVEWLLPPSSVSRLHLLFPDPWPKARHHKRRLVQQEFLSAVERVLAPGGEFLFKTDHAEYFEWASEELRAHPSLREIEWPDGAFYYPQTDFEAQWRAEGRSVFQLRAIPVSPD